MYVCGCKSVTFYAFVCILSTVLTVLTIMVFLHSSFLFCGILWAIFSLGVSILRVFALQLDERTTIIGWFTNNVTSPDQHDVLKVRYVINTSLILPVLSFFSSL